MSFSKEESREIWEQNAAFWDAAMGDASNDFHREAVRPGVTELLRPGPGDYILDAACGNGNYSAYLAEQGADVLAFDYSEAMVALARKRRARQAGRIEFCVADATDGAGLLALRRERPFTKAVCNMAVMDITDIAPLFFAVHALLGEGGIFVFATQHPCFVTLTDRYMTPHAYYDIALARAAAAAMLLPPLAAGYLPPLLCRRVRHRRATRSVLPDRSRAPRGADRPAQKTMTPRPGSQRLCAMARMPAG